MATPTYTPIASITLGSSASSVTFSSIPQDYRDLVLVIQGGTSSASTVSLEILPNGSSSDGSLVNMIGNGSSATSSTSSKIFADFDASDSLAITQVMDYSATDKHKTFLIRSNCVNNPRVVATAGRWAQTTAITSLEISDTGGQTLDSGTTLSLYGIAK